LAGKRGASGDELDDGRMGERNGGAGDGGSIAGASGRTGVDRLRSADELWRDGDASAASSSAADGICRADKFRIVDELDATSVHERLCG
jgi:hypothetical protein